MPHIKMNETLREFWKGIYGGVTTIQEAKRWGKWG
jgi:hypothetical protein